MSKPPHDQVPSIACVNHSTLELGVDWKRLVAALDAYANTIFAPVWGTPARILDAGASPFVPTGCWGLVLMDDPDREGLFGYHDLTQDGLPLAKVFVRDTIEGGEKVSVVASHEVAEMLVDPGVQLGARGPDGHTWFAYETSDPVEHEDFRLDGVDLSNFAYPAWFEGFRRPRSTRFDHMDSCRAPFELRPGGYIDVFHTGAWQPTFGSPEAAERFRASAHPRAGLRRQIMRHRSDHSHLSAPPPPPPQRHARSRATRHS